MGLDMYLNAERYFGYGEAAPMVESITVKSVRAEAAYWRKANQIHQWFVEKVQDGEDECREHFVSREQLQELIRQCEMVLQDPNKAKDLLPTQSGFFFGGTDYDEWYLSQLRDTVKQLTEALQKFPEDKWDFYYRSSW